MLLKSEKVIKMIPYITLYDFQSREVYSDSLYQYIPRTSLIIEKSIQIFNDPNPCFIHQSAVIKRILFELEDGLLELSEGKDQCFSLEQLPIQMQYLLNASVYKQIDICWKAKTKR